MKKNILTFTLLFIFALSHSQITFEQTYGGINDDHFYSVRQTNDGGYICIGSTENYGATDYDIYILKTDLIGDSIWAKRITDTLNYNDMGYSIEQTNDGGYIFGGSLDGKAYVQKIDDAGNVVWGKFYDEGFMAHSVQHTFDNGYVFAGKSKDYKVYLVKTYPDGDTMWTRKYGYATMAYGYCVQQTIDSGYIVIGSILGYDGIHHDAYLIRVNSIGDTLWTRKYDGPSNVTDYGNYVIVENNGDYIVSCSFDWAVNSSHARIMRINDNGNILWESSIGNSSYTNAYTIQKTLDNAYVFTGATIDTTNNDLDVILVKLNALGDTLWIRTFGGLSSDHAYGVDVCDDGGYIVAGYTESFGAGSEDMYLIKTDNNGILTPIHELDNSQLCLNVFPNPFTGDISIELNIGDKKIDVYNNIGQLVFSQDIIVKREGETRKINLKLKEPGFYIVKVTNKNGIRVNKVIKR